MNKRTFLKTSLIMGAGTVLGGPVIARGGFGDVNLNSADEFKQDELSYSFDALEPHIDARTMELHYTKHHAGYTKNLNAAVESENLKGKPINDIFSSISKYSNTVRNNGGGFYNHNLFWKVMSPNGGKPSQGLTKAIDKDFGSMDKFREEFSKAAASQFGSGWAWLIKDGGKLAVTSTPNQDNPLMDVASKKGSPILALDVWEHAYYLNYQNRRADYISAFWNVINWDYVSELYDKT